MQNTRIIGPAGSFFMQIGCVLHPNLGLSIPSAWMTSRFGAQKRRDCSSLSETGDTALFNSMGMANRRGSAPADQNAHSRMEWGGHPPAQFSFPQRMERSACNERSMALCAAFLARLHAQSHSFAAIV
jgi:hypothetical protein